MISVIIPARNEEKNIPSLLESLKNQDYNKKFEILVIDGKSRDRTVKVAKTYGCRVIVQKKLGISNARNLGWQNAKGDVLVFLEADQAVENNLLKEVEKVFRNKEISCARPNYIPIGKNWIQKALTVQIELATKRQKAWGFPTIFRKMVFKNVGGWDESIDFAEDREFPKRIEAYYKTKFIEKARVNAKPVDTLTKLYKQGRWYGRNIFDYIKKTKDLTTLLGIFIYSSFLPLLILSFFHGIFLILFILDFLTLFFYSLEGFIFTKNLYAFLMIPINIIRGFGELVGMIESIFVRRRGKV